MRHWLCAIAAAFAAGSLEGNGLERRPAAGRVAASVESHLVLIPVTVTDRQGKTVTDLDPRHLRVFDESELRPIVSFSKEEAPVSLAVVLDLSASMEKKLPHAIAAVRAVTEAIGDDDEGLLVTFADRPELRVPLTRDVAAITDRLLFAKARGSTALIDAVYLALHHVGSARNPRRALLVISDGGDNNSRYQESELIKMAKEADAQIYSISIRESAHDRGERTGAFLLDKLSAVTGGLHFTIRTRQELPAAAGKIAHAIQNLYVIGYKPPAAAWPGKWRKVKIHVESPRPLRLSAKKGYFSPD